VIDGQLIEAINIERPWSIYRVGGQFTTKILRSAAALGKLVVTQKPWPLTDSIPQFLLAGSLLSFWNRDFSHSEPSSSDI
jgi:hypothetical protein